MRKIMLLMLLLSIRYAHAQLNSRDSLRQLLHNEKTDTGRVLRLADLAFAYSESEPDTTMKLAIEALSLATRIGFVKGQAVSLNRIGNACEILGDYPKAMEIWLKALQINEKIHNLDGLHRNNNNIGVVYKDQEDYRQALSYFFKAKDLAEKINAKALSTTLTNIAEIYLYLKNYDSAKVFALQANSIASSINYSRITGNSFRIMGEIYSETGQFNLSLEFYRSGIPHLIIADNYLSLSETYLGMAKLFGKTKQNDSLLFYARRSLFLARERRFTKELRDAGRFLFSYYKSSKNADSAFFYQDIARAANDSIFSQQKQRQLQSLAFEETLRQQELVAMGLRAKEERNQNLQYAAIAIGLATFIIIFLVLSRSIIVREGFINFFGIFGLLAVFEFINLYIHPHLAHLTNDSPVLMLAILMCIAALLIPLHHRLEKWITKIMVEKNKMIRLNAAKRTIATLGVEQIN